MPLQEGVRLTIRATRHAGTQPDEKYDEKPHTPVPSRMISHAIGLWRLPWFFVRHLSLLEAQMGSAVRICAPDGGGTALSLFPLRVPSLRQLQATTPSLPSTELESAQKRRRTSARNQRLAEPRPSVARGNAALSGTFAWTNICVSEYMSRKNGTVSEGSNRRSASVSRSSSSRARFQEPHESSP